MTIRSPSPICAATVKRRLIVLIGGPLGTGRRRPYPIGVRYLVNNTTGNTVKTVAVNDDSFLHEVLASSVPILVDFWAPWCGPCLKLAPILDQIAIEKAADLTVAKLDVDTNPATPRRYRVVSIPTLILFRDGEPLKRIAGTHGKAAIVRALTAAL